MSLTAPQWLCRLLGDDYFQTAIDVDLWGDKFSDNDLDEIAKLQSLENYTIGLNTSLTDGALARFRSRLPNLLP